LGIIFSREGWYFEMLACYGIVKNNSTKSKLLGVFFDQVMPLNEEPAFRVANKLYHHNDFCETEYKGYGDILDKYIIENQIQKRKGLMYKFELSDLIKRHTELQEILYKYACEIYKKVNLQSFRNSCPLKPQAATKADFIRKHITKYLFLGRVYTLH
jgi:hypothetical protein